jgi:hypothetical protein
MPMLERIGQPIGSSGVPLVGNESWRSDEYNVDLATPQQAVATYEQMRKSDAKVRASANNLIYALLAAQWRIDAAKENPNGEEHAKFVRSVLMPGETYGYSGSSSWLSTLRNILTAPFFGFSVQEKVWAWRPRDGKQVYGAIEARLPKTIVHWNLTPSGPSRLESVTQYAQQRNGRHEEKKIPAKNLIVITFNREGDNYWGESVMRPAHFHWRVKRDLIKFDAIQKERLGGIFWVQSKEGTKPTAQQIRDAKGVIQNFRVHEKEGLYFPHVFDFHAEFPPGGGGGASFIESAEYHDRQIEQSMMSQFQSLGSGEKGALSVGEVQLGFMLLAYQGTAKLVEDGVGEQAIVELIDTNFGEQEFYPRLACENFLQMKPDRLASVAKPLIDCGLVRVDKPLRVFFRQKLAFPDEDEKTMEPVPQAQGAFGQPGAARPGRETAPAGGAEDPGAESSAAGPAGKPGALNEGPGPAGKLAKAAGAAAIPLPRRALLAHEKHVAFDDIKRILDSAPAKIWYRDVLPIREQQIKDMAAAVAASTEAQLAAGNLPRPLLKELGDALAAALLTIYRAGRRSVLDEAVRAHASAKAKAADPGPSLEDDYPPEPTDAQRTWIKRLGQALAFGMTLSLTREAVRSGQAAQDQRLAQPDVVRAVERALEALSPNVLQAEMGGKATQAFTTGRVEQMQDMLPEVATIYYSAMGDENTCAACDAMDGEELDPQDFENQVPNPDCAGAIADNCRCFPVAVWTVAGEAA